MLNFSHICLYFNDLIRTYFCEIYVILWDLIEGKTTKFLIPITVGPGLLPVDRPVDRGRSRLTGPVNRHAQTCMATWAGRPVDRLGRPLESFALWNWPRSTAESCCSLYLVTVDRAVDRWLNGHKNDRWPVDWKDISALSRLPTGRIFESYKYAFS